MAKTIRALLAALAACVLLMGCPPAIVREALVYAEDDIAPSITVSSPANRSSFDSSVTFIGTVVDSAATTGDGEGKVSSLAYTVQDHESLSGTAEVQTDGAFAFTIDTHELSGDQTVAITAVDWNGNTSTLKVELNDPGQGPDVSITSPAADSAYASSVTVVGVVNNRGDSVTPSEVASLAYQVLGEAVTDDVTFSAEDGSFSFTFSTVGLEGVLIIRLTATDKNGRTSTEDLELLDRSYGPTLVISSPLTGASYQTSVTVTGAVTDYNSAASTAEVKSLDYVVLGTAVSDDDVAFTAGTGAFSFTFSTVTPTLMDGTIVLRITAEDMNGRTTIQDLYLSEVTDGPYTDVDTPADGGTYGATITLAGRVQDSAASTTLADVKSLTYRIGSDDPTTLTYNATTGAFSTVIDTFTYSSTIIIKVTAYDLHNHSTVQTITLTSNLAAPEVTFTSYPVMYSSVATTDVTVAGTVSDPDTLKNGQMTYRVTKGATTYTTVIIPDADIDAAGNFTFSFDPVDLGASGEITVTVIAIDEGDRQTSAPFAITDDPSDPVIVAASCTLAADNSYLDLRFDEAAYTAAGSGALTPTDLALTFAANGGTATAVSIPSLTKTDGVTPLEGGEQTIRLALAVTGLPSGVETITVKPASSSAIYDAVGNAMLATATTGAIVLNDLTIPDTPGTPDLASGDDTGISSTDNFTRTTSGLTLSGAGVENKAVITIYDNGTQIATATASGTSWTKDVSLAVGEHDITVTAADSGGTSLPSSPLTIVVDTSSPTAIGAPTLDAADDSDPDGDGYTSLTSSLTFSVTATEAGTVRLYRGATEIGTAQSATAGALTVTFDGISLTAGSTYSITARLTDLAGNDPTTSATLSLTVDNTISDPGAPVLAAGDDSDPDGDGYTLQTSNLTFSATATEAGTVRLYSDGTEIGTAQSATAGALTVTFDGIALTAGATYSITARLTDLAGNGPAESDPLSLTVDNSITAPGAPVLAASDDSGEDGDGLTSQTSNLTFDVTATEPGTVRLYRDGTMIGSAQSATEGDLTVTFDGITLTAGATYDITARLTDLAGNGPAESDPLSLTVDNTAETPNAPVLDTADDSGEDGDGLTSQTTDLTFDVTATEPGTVRLYRDGTMIGTAQSATEGDLTVTFDGITLTAGATYDITARLTDLAGNGPAESAELSLTVDDTSDPPDPPTSSANPSAQLDVTFSITATEPGTVSLYVDGTATGETAAATAGNLTVEIVHSFSTDGTYAVRATLTDLADNPESNLSDPALDQVINATPPPPSAPSTTSNPIVQGEMEITVAVAEAGTVTLYVDGTQSGTTQEAASAGNVIFTRELTVGTYSITATLTVASDESEPSDPLELDVTES